MSTIHIDGISGWSNVDANPALFSSLLTHYIQCELEKLDQGLNDFEKDLNEQDDTNYSFNLNKSPQLDQKENYPSQIKNVNELPLSIYEKSLPMDILKKAYQQMPRNLIGSSTLTLAMIRGRELRVVHLGDCGVFVLRQGREIYRTREQLHSFNFPFQLGMGCRSRPEDSDTAFISIEPSDIVIVASDGLFDNLWDVDIFQMIDYELKKVNYNSTRLDPKHLSQLLVSEARIASMDNYRAR